MNRCLGCSKPLKAGRRQRRYHSYECRYNAERARRKPADRCSVCGTWLPFGQSKCASKCYPSARTPERWAWSNMIARCTNPKTKEWRHYGGRGIKVCAEWRASFQAFRAHVGPRPSPEHSLDRINNDGNYEPGNVRWATKAEQNLNRRKYACRCERCGHEWLAFKKPTACAKCKSRSWNVKPGSVPLGRPPGAGSDR